MNKDFFSGIIICLCLLFFLSCKTKQIATALAHEKIDTADVVSQMEAQQFHYKTLSLKFNAEVQSAGENTSFSGNIYAVKDSVIWVSLQKLGLEVFRLLVTPDSLKLLDRINKICVLTEIKTFNEVLHTGFDFDLLQAMITGNDMKTYETKGFTEENKKDFIILSYTGRKKLQDSLGSVALNQEIWLFKSNYKIHRNSISESLSGTSASFEATYSDFLEAGGQKFPQNIEISYKSTKIYKATINYTRVSPEKKENAPFSIPAGYTRQTYFTF